MQLRYRSGRATAGEQRLRSRETARGARCARLHGATWKATPKTARSPHERGLAKNGQYGKRDNSAPKLGLAAGDRANYAKRNSRSSSTATATHSCSESKTTDSRRQGSGLRRTCGHGRSDMERWALRSRGPATKDGAAAAQQSAPKVDGTTRPERRATAERPSGSGRGGGQASRGRLAAARTCRHLRDIRRGATPQSGKTLMQRREPLLRSQQFPPLASMMVVMSVDVVA